jgi:hypothetical protein
LVEESLVREQCPKKIHFSTVYNVPVRTGEIERERRKRTQYKSFQWGNPEMSIQCDLTRFNGVPVTTKLDDHSRGGWSEAISSEKDVEAIESMKCLHPSKFDNLLPGNVSQFNRKNSNIRQYCDLYLNEKHIWSSIHHPETLGKPSAYQKGLKDFLC